MSDVAKKIDPFKVRKTHPPRMYEICVLDWSGEGQDIYSTGQDLEELIDNAELWFPGAVKPSKSEGDDVREFITQWFVKHQEPEKELA